MFIIILLLPGMKKTKKRHLFFGPKRNHSKHTHFAPSPLHDKNVLFYDLAQIVLGSEGR